MALRYIEKGAALHDAIEAAGYLAYWHDGEFVTPNPADEPVVQAIIDTFPTPDLLAEAKAAKCAQVSAYAKLLRDTVIAAVSAGEMASWPIKRAEALEFGRTGDAALCPALSAEAQARGVSLSELVAKVNANGARFIAAEAAIGGADGRHRDAISRLTILNEVTEYDFSSGWPEI